VYQQRSEYEARLKVHKMKRDLNLKDFQEHNKMPEFKRNIKIVNLEKPEEEGQEATIDVDSELKEFVERSQKVLETFYERAYVNDKLGGLSSKEIVHRIKDTPKNTKVFVKKYFFRLF
jgi:hypothetical protein